MSDCLPLSAIWGDDIVRPWSVMVSHDHDWLPFMTVYTLEQQEKSSVFFKLLGIPLFCIIIILCYLHQIKTKYVAIETIIYENLN